MSWQTQTFRELNLRVDRAVGGKTASGLEKMGIHTIGDLLRHCPRRYISGTDMSDFSSLRVDDEVALIARVHRAEHAVGRSKQRVTVKLTDGHGFVSATFFADKDYLIRHWMGVLAPGARGIFVGKVSEFHGELQLSHPDFVVLDEHNRMVAGSRGDRREAMARQAQRDTLVGIYPSTRSMPTWIIADSVALALEMVGRRPEPLPSWVLERAGVMELMPAFTSLHAPVTAEEAQAAGRRLRFDEALGAQLSLAYRRAARRAMEVPAIRGGELLAAFDAQLPFQLTAGQREVSEQIFADLSRSYPMSRLLQGEVGSGKTVVALRAMLAAVDSGCQAALLAPTEVLARQHYRSITRLMGDLALGMGGTEVELLTGSRSTAAKRKVQDGLAAGQVSIVVGTHALLSQGIGFARLGLVVVDEQHRFGVQQRSALAEGAAVEPHTLVMTATPIPRSVAMTVFGDLDTSALRDLPAGRAGVKTVFVNTERHPAWVGRAWERIREEVAEGRQAFVVCPRIDAEDSSTPDEWLGEVPRTRELTSVVQLAEELAAGPLAGLRVAAVHGRQPAAERDETMTRFAEGKIDVLVATTVIEVGVDVPNAAMMVVVDADRFGLSQLHQLRGRIGRGQHPGLCLLLAPVTDPASPVLERLEAMASSTDGFELAELDLKLRREGNVLGAEQSGAPSTLKLLRVLDDADLIQLTKQIADEIVEADPKAEAGWVRDVLRQVSAAQWAARS
ncbi:MAG: ATP-dependent DNA helicase RecG [Propionibacteriaceae bacterium]|nr:ATP-dependent DNA helicase RecG [Propionibacteriaceae bacterium]